MVERWCWVNYLLIWLTEGQGPTVLAVGEGGGCLDMSLFPLSTLL